jgi:gliding motility-associated-like protein
MKAKSTLLTCCLALLPFLYSAAQVVANFTIDSPSGCSPLTVNFTNTSTGTGTLTYSWDLGNGNTSTLKDPKAVYSTAGTYSVKLTVSNGSANNSIQKTIVVHKSPTANFTSTAKGCVPVNISFTDASIKGDANITNWSWDFRNGVTSNDPNPVNGYTSPGKYNVYLEVTDANGCKAYIDKPAVDVVEKPMVSFYATPSNSCTVPATIQFTNQSTGGGALTYAWDFGAGVTSTQMHPKNTYNTFGTYNVKLTVSSDYGCSSVMDVPSVVLGEVKAQGTLKQGGNNIIDNSIVCAGDIDFNNTSVGNTNCFWDFGDGSTTYANSGKHTYPNAGNYKVKLIAAPHDACADTVIWNITVEKAVAGFNFTPETSCNPSSSVAFSNQSSANITSYKWTFHDASVLTDKDVVKTFTQPKDKDQYVIHEMFNYPVKLTVTSTNGCKDSIERTFTVHQPTALFSASVVEGCAPLNVSFTDSSLSAESAKERRWLFGEGADHIATARSTSHIYNTPGTYQVKLVFTNTSDCKDTSSVLTIKVGSQVTPDFSVSPTTICSSTKLTFTDLSPAGISRWHYSVGSKSVPACSEIASPSVYMKTDTGALAVKLMVENNGCISEVIKPNAIKNDGPFGSFTYEANCNQARAIVFNGVAKKATSFKWEFGDSEINTNNLQLTHFYPAEGDYTVKFITFNGACSDTVFQVVKVRDHQPAFSLKTEICAGDPVFFNSKKSHKLHQSCSEKYLWNFGDLSPMIRTHKDSVSHIFADGRTFNVKLYAFYDNGCVDSVTNSIRVYKPIPGFTTDKSEGCAPLPVTFTDTSLPDVHLINFWSWDFGDGNTVNYTSKENTVSNTFGYPGEYTAVLLVSDDFGCRATFEKKITTAIPTATFNANNTQVCAGTQVEFFMHYPEADSAIWNFGNGNVLRSVAVPVKFQYADTGRHDVTLTVYKYGCSDVFTYNNYIQVQKADARFTASDTVYNCYPRIIKYYHTSGKKDIITGKWYYGHGNNSSPVYMDTTSYIYTQPGTYRALLEVMSSFGCTDTFSRQIKITGPTGQFAVTPMEACRGNEITYTLSDTANVYSYEWDLGDGNFSTDNPVKHRYHTVGNKTAKLILFGDKGKCTPPAVEQSIYIYEVSAGINLSDTAVCEGTTLEFKNSSVGASTYKWDFGDGATSTTLEPSRLFEPGTYKVSLMTEGLHGCKDTAFQYVLISRMPTLTAGNDTTVCIGGSAYLNATSNKDLRWEPVTYLSSPAIPNPVAIPDQTITYTVYATDPVSQCFRKEEVQVTVQPVPDVQVEVEANSFVAGRPVQINVSSETGATYEWSPADFLSCANCANPVTTARVNTAYLLKVTDKNNCFTVEKKVDLNVNEGEKAFDVPSAFTPSGGEPNNIFKVQGYNVKLLLEFKIYNRWGNLVFSSTDLSKGWDGTYQGKAQPVDSYVYTIKIETFDGRVETKTGTILLLR